MQTNVNPSRTVSDWLNNVDAPGQTTPLSDSSTASTAFVQNHCFNTNSFATKEISSATNQPPVQCGVSVGLRELGLLLAATRRSALALGSQDA